MKLFVDFWRFPRIYDDLHNLITKLFLFMCWKILWSQHKRTVKNRGKTKNQQTMPYQVIAHLCIEIIDRSQWNEAVLGDFFKFHVLFGLFTISYLICSNFQILKIKIGNNIFFFIFRAQGLKASITSGSRLRTQSEHFAYILIDRASNDGLGSVVGLLKGKYMTLFVHCVAYLLEGVVLGWEQG